MKAGWIREREREIWRMWLEWIIYMYIYIMQFLTRVKTNVRTWTPMWWSKERPPRPVVRTKSTTCCEGSRRDIWGKFWGERINVWNERESSFGISFIGILVPQFFSLFCCIVVVDIDKWVRMPPTKQTLRRIQIFLVLVRPLILVRHSRHDSFWRMSSCSGCLPVRQY